MSKQEIEENVKSFANQINITDLRETDKCLVVLWIAQTRCGEEGLGFDDVFELVTNLGLAHPNKSRLRRILNLDKRFLKRAAGLLVATPTAIELCNSKYHSEEPVSSGEFVDEGIFEKCPKHIIKLIKEINCTYASNSFDGCALLLRKLTELLLILSFDKTGSINEVVIQKGGHDEYVDLSTMVGKAVKKSVFGIQRYYDTLDSVRNLGNIAAHTMWVNVRKSDLDNIKAKIRIVLEQLCSISGY